MRFRNLAALAILLLSTQFIFGQDPCGYRGKSSWLTWYQANRQQLVQSRGSDTSWLYVPVTLHIVGPSNAITLDAGPAVRAICNMNEQYADAHIRFFLMPGDPIRYLFNSEWNDHDFNGGADLITSNNLPGRMNAYLVANPAGNCGYSWLDAIVMGRGCSGPDNTTWAHEAGHHFSLPHPFVAGKAIPGIIPNLPPFRSVEFRLKKRTVPIVVRPATDSAIPSRIICTIAGLAQTLKKAQPSR